MASKDFGRFVERFLSTINVGIDLPADVEVLRPYTDPEVQRVLRLVCRKYYAGGHPRVGVWGINPGRFGAGVTGLSFTDPWAVVHDLAIPTTLEGRRELSAEFISRVIAAYGGPQVFYRDVYMSALCPLGFTRHGVNINFYDDTQLAISIRPKIIEWMGAALDAGVRRDVSIVLGAGKLRSYMNRHIRTNVGISEVVYLDHPRYIMQYRRRDVDEYVELYVKTIHSCFNSVLR